MHLGKPWGLAELGPRRGSSSVFREAGGKAGGGGRRAGPADTEDGSDAVDDAADGGDSGDEDSSPRAAERDLDEFDGDGSGSGWVLAGRKRHVQTAVRPWQSRQAHCVAPVACGASAPYAGYVSLLPRQY